MAGNRVKYCPLRAIECNDRCAWYDYSGCSMIDALRDISGELAEVATAIKRTARKKEEPQNEQA